LFFPARAFPLDDIDERLNELEENLNESVKSQAATPTVKLAKPIDMDLLLLGGGGDHQHNGNAKALENEKF
jgi:hypothetical protein